MVYRLFKVHGLVTSPAYIVNKTAISSTPKLRGAYGMPPRVRLARPDDDMKVTLKQIANSKVMAEVFCQSGLDL